MRTLGGLSTHLTSNATTLSTCWRIVRRDGAIYTFTDCDRDLLIDGEVYLAAVGYRRSAVQSAANGAVDNLDIEGVVQDTSITDADVRRGLWDYAEIHVFAVNWQDPSSGRARLRRGWLGEVSSNSAGEFKAELRGMQQLLAQIVGDVYTPECRAQFGDAKCRVSLELFSTTGTVTADPASGTVFPGVLSDDYTGGVLTWTSGLNDGFKSEILATTGTVIAIFDPAPYVIANGDTFSAVQGCPHTVAACNDRFNNVANFRGEPYVPGADKLLFVGIPNPSKGGGKK